MTDLDHVWALPPAKLALSRDEIHIWRASLDPPSSFVQEAMHTLSPDEQLRARQLYFERDQKRFVVGRGLLRMILGHYLGIAPDRLAFRYGHAGKPALSAPPGMNGIEFNVAHSHALALYAVTRNRKIGIDLERVRPILEAEHIAERIFSPRENAVLRALPPIQRHVAFFHGWTRKEAYLKACGDGLARALPRIDVSLAPSETARPLEIEGDPQEAGRWSLQELRADPGYVAALAVEGDIVHCACWQWPDWL